MDDHELWHFFSPFGNWLFTVSVTSAIFLLFSLSQYSRKIFSRTDFHFVMLHEATRIFFRLLLSPLAFLALLGFLWQGKVVGTLGFSWPTEIPFWAQITLAFLVIDFTDYWIHRMMHLPIFWRVHAIHHAPQELTGWTYFRSHPLQYVPFRLRSLAMLLLGFSPEALAITPFFYWVLGAYSHSDWRFDIGVLKYVVISPHFHRWHHSNHPDAIDKNFSTILPLWDWLFGTFYMPRGVEPHSFGDPTVPKRLWEQVWHPFRRARAQSVIQ